MVGLPRPPFAPRHRLHGHPELGATAPLLYLDSVLDLASATDDWPEDAKFRWNVEANWPLLHWMKNRRESDRIRFFDRVREGRIEICALPFSMHTEAYSIDELARQLRFAEDLRGSTTCPYRPPCRPTYQGQRSASRSLVDADVRYLSVAHNYAGRSAPHLVGGQELTRPFYWRAQRQTPVGVAHGLAARQRVHGGQPGRSGGGLPGHPRGIAGLSGGPCGASLPVPGAWGEHLRMDGPGSLLQRHESALSSRCAPPEGAGLFSDNASPNIVPAEIVREWNEKWAYPHLRLATNSEFFAEAEESLQEYRDLLRRLDRLVGRRHRFGARHLGFNRRAQADVRTAQTLHTLANALTDDGADRRDEIDEIYESMALFDEHTWGAANPWMDGLERRESGALQWETKAGFARDASEIPRPRQVGRPPPLARFRTVRRLTRLRYRIQPQPLGAHRPGQRVRAREPYCTPAPLAVVDGATRACALRGRGSGKRPVQGAGSRLTFIARDVPAFGYTRYDLVEGDEEHEDQESGNEPCIENEYYLVRFDLARAGSPNYSTRLPPEPGRHGRPVRLQPVRLRPLRQRPALQPPLQPHPGDRSGPAWRALGRGARRGYTAVVQLVWDRVTVRLVDERADIVESTLTLYRGVRRLDITNRIAKVGTPEKESVYFALQFNVTTRSTTR